LGNATSRVHEVLSDSSELGLSLSNEVLHLLLDSSLDVIEDVLLLNREVGVGPS
jgi:hypothetical protein